MARHEQGTLYLTLCSGCSRWYGLPYPRPQRQLSNGAWMEPDPWFCQRKACQGYREAREKRQAEQANIGVAHRQGPCHTGDTKKPPTTIRSDTMLTPEDRQDAADARTAARKGRAYAIGAWNGEEPWESTPAPDPDADHTPQEGDPF